jgi:ribonuclease-3
MADHSCDPEKEDLLQCLIGYTFRDPDLRSRAITRVAWLNDKSPGEKIDWPGLPTLGDAVIGLAVVNHYYGLGKTPGEITAEKTARVTRMNHTAVARHIGLKSCLRLGGCEGKTEQWDDGDALGESLEEVIGAVYLDCVKNGRDGIAECDSILTKIGFFEILKA